MPERAPRAADINKDPLNRLRQPRYLVRDENASGRTIFLWHTDIQV